MRCFRLGGGFGALGGLNCLGKDGVGKDNGKEKQNQDGAPYIFLRTNHRISPLIDLEIRIRSFIFNRFGSNFQSEY
jgi:hypothetical protein